MSARQNKAMGRRARWDLGKGSWDARIGEHHMTLEMIGALQSASSRISPHRGCATAVDI